MGLVYLILFHKEPDQLFRLIDTLNEGPVCFVVHVCKNFDDFDSLEERARTYDNLVFCERERGTWGSYQTVKATFNGIEKALIFSHEFSHIVLLSAQDYPLRSNREIQDFLQLNQGRTFMEALECQPPLNEDGEYYHPIKHQWTSRDESGRYKFFNLKIHKNFYVRLHDEPDPRGGLGAMFKYLLRRSLATLVGAREFYPELKPFFGPQWCIFSHEHCLYLHEHFPVHSSYHRYMQNVFCPDEMFFHTALMNSEHKEAIRNVCLHYTRWTEYNHPDIFKRDCLEELQTAAVDKLFARKFDLDVDPVILDQIDAKLLLETTEHSG